MGETGFHGPNVISLLAGMDGEPFSKGGGEERSSLCPIGTKFWVVVHGRVVVELGQGSKRLLDEGVLMKGGPKHDCGQLKPPHPDDSCEQPGPVFAQSVLSLMENSFSAVGSHPSIHKVQNVSRRLRLYAKHKSQTTLGRQKLETNDINFELPRHLPLTLSL